MRLEPSKARLSKVEPSSAEPSKTLALEARREWRWFWWWSFLTLAATCLPLVWAWLATPAGAEFTGLLFNAHDSNTYLAKMNEGRRGEWVFSLAYTSESPGPGAVTYLFYLLLGKLAGLLNLPNVLVFQMARLVCGFLLLWSSYWFSGLLFGQPDRRRLAFRLVCFSSGLGWLVGPFNILPVSPTDFWVAESYTFLTIFANPHFPLATALLTWGIGGGLLGLESRRFRPWLGAALASFLLGFVHPFVVATLGVVLGLYWLRLAFGRGPDWAGFAGLLGLGLAGFPGAFLTLWGTWQDPLLSRWMAQNQVTTLALPILLLGYGLLVPLSLAGGWWVERILPNSSVGAALPGPGLARWRLATTWVAGTAGLLVLPISFSMRFLEGMHLPLCCLAAAGWFYLTEGRLSSRGQKIGQPVLVGLAGISSLVMVVISIGLIYLPSDDLRDPVRSPYLSQGERGAIDWLNAQARPGEIVLTGPVLGNLLPGRTPVRVFYGHAMETLDPEVKLAILRQFCDPASTMSQRYAIISSWGLKYLVYGWRERRIGTFDPATGGWPPVYDRDGIQIYRLS